MSEIVTTIREALGALATSDRSLSRFGARHHRYELAPPLDSYELRAVEMTLGALPEDLREFATTIGSGGAGPYLGMIPLARAATLAYALTPTLRALPVIDLGCGYAAVVALHGDSPGTLWIDARAIGVVQPIRPSFTALYLEWIDRLAHNELPDPLVPPGACALATALGGFLGMHEQRLGLAPGTIAGEPLREALAQLRPGAIAIAAERSPLHRDGTRVDPCLACATLLANLGVSGDIVAPGAW